MSTQKKGQDHGSHNYLTQVTVSNLHLYTWSARHRQCLLCHERRAASSAPAHRRWCPRYGSEYNEYHHPETPWSQGALLLTCSEMKDHRHHSALPSLTVTAILYTLVIQNDTAMNTGSFWHFRQPLYTKLSVSPCVICNHILQKCLQQL